jgi:phosphonate transport system substrate-binding protein
MSRHPFKYSTIIVTLLLLFSFTNSCSNQQETPSENNAQSPHKKFYIGLIPEQDLFSQIDNFLSDKLDGAFFGSFTGALAIKKLGVAPLARPVWLDGKSTYYGLIIVRKDSAIKNALDMKGKRFAFVDKATTAGWLLPLSYFKQNDIEDYREWFSETYFAGTHEDVIYDVLNGKVDIGAAKNTVFDRLARKDSKLLDELQILAGSPEVPANALAVKKELDNSLKIKLKNILLQMDQDKRGREILAEFGAHKFIETTIKDYSPVFSYAEKTGLDLRKYDYIND